jgi:hypothetical protein
VEPKVQRKIGWMVLRGLISGLFGKGPELFWEKSWGTIKPASYCEHIVPLMADYVNRRWLVLMQDDAGEHAARDTLGFFFI